MLKPISKLFTTILFLCFVSASVFAQMSGTYTIDKTKTGTTNFKTFKGAVNALNSSGVSGPVLFKVANGTYTEQVSFLYVSGSSTTNTITFQGSDSSKVVLQYDCSQYESVIKINAAANFVFEGMTIKSTNNTYGYGVHITSSAENITVKNCIVSVASRTGVSVDCIPINIAGGTYATYGENGENVTIKNSILSGGYFGINIRGTNNSLLSETFNIENNELTGQYVYPIYAVYAKDINILNNSIDNTILYYAYGVYTNQCAGGEISYNKIYAGRFGLYLYLHNYYNRADSIVVSNNEISDFDDASYQSGIYSSSTFNLKAYHNTISTNGTVSNFAYSAMYVNAPYNHSILNNNLKASGNSAVFFLGSGSLGSTKVDYNNYSVGANGSLISWQGTTYNSINDLKNAVSSQNQNSTSEDPLFSSSRNLVPQAPGINNRALNGLSSIDLNGNSRPKAPDAIADIGAYEYYVTPNDIDLITVSDPLIAKTGNNDVGVIIKNNGSSTYKDTVFLQYKIDNGSWVKDTAIYSNFLIGTVDTFFFSKKWNISGSGTFNVCVSILPGITGDPDSLVGDTICETKCVGRSGTFTIDATGNGDYRTFNAAINSLSCGIAGPITFEVEPGTYNERLTLEPVLGASAQNTITFEGTDKDKVIIDYDGTSSLPATVLFDDADYVTFKNVTIVNEGNQVACGFWLRESANFNTIENCNIKLDSTTAGYSLTGILVANSTSSSSTTIPGNASENLEFKNNLIVGGSHGIRINGTGYNTTSENILIQNNTIRNFYFQGLNAIYISSSKIRKNHISKPRTTTAYGIIMYYNHNDSIDGNYVEGGRYGMYIYYENTYNRNTFSSIANNMVTNLRDPNYQVGIFTYSGYNLSIYHNSVWTNGTYSNPFYAAMNMYYCYNSFAKNNSLKAGEGMIFAKYYGNISIGAIDYNNYYGTGAAKYYYDGLTFTDLSTWQSIKSKFNQSSKEGDPNYNSITDLHVTGAQLNNAALKGLGITTDFDGDKRPFSPDKKVDIGADEYYVSPYDIDLVSLDSPIVPIIGNNDIKIILRNTGIQSIDDDTIVVSYSIDGTLQVRDTVIINSLAPNNNYTYTFSKQWSISTGKTYQLCAQLDTFFKPDPDSLNIQKKCMNMCPGARGSYTIDASGNGDFKTFRGALNALSCGINGAVTFNVKNGIYREHIHLNEVLGASANNSITFKGESKNGVIVRYQGTVDTHQTVHLEGADYFHLENMTIANTSSVYSKGVRISNTADYNTFTNIKFNLPANALGGNCMSVQISDEGLNTIGNAGNYNVFEKCSFENGYYGVRLFGIGTTSLIYGNEFIDCSFRNHRVFGIYGYYQGQLNVENCSFDSLQLDYYQLYLYMCSQSSIIGNNIKDGKYGLRLLYENYYFQEETSEIVNNMASGQNSANGENYSMDIYYCYNVKFFHNSLMMSTGSSGSVARFYYGSGHDVRNNSFSKTSNADLITNTSTSFSEVDFNNYYIGSSNNFVNFNGAGYDDLAKWQSAVSGFNRNSKEGDPGYNSASDLTIDPKTNQLANWGSITTGITNDFEGDIRNPQSPDIGADEFSDLYDIGVTALQNPTTACNLSNTEEITIQVKNLGNIVVPSGELLPVAYKIGTNSDVVDTFILTSNFAKGDSLNFTFKTKADFSAHKTYSLSAWTNIANDSLRSNDTLSTNLSSYEIPQADFNYSTTACSNEDIEFTDNSSANTATISSYNWNFGNGITTNTKNSKVAYSVDGSYSVKLVIESNNGCKDSIIKSIDVNEKPTAAFTSTNLCFGDSATFANTSSIATATGAVFNWDFDDNTTTSKRTPKHKFSSTKNYNVELIATSANGCKDTVVNTVSISPNPVASFSFSNECKGDTNYFTNTSNVPNGYNPSYSWKFGDGNGASTENTKYVYGAIGNYTVELTAQLSNGCSSTAQNSIDIFSKPQPQFSVANGCSGDSIAFTNASTIKLDTIKTHSWAFGDGNSSIKTNPKNLYNNNGSYDVKLILTSVKGCVDSISKSLDIYEKPTAAYTVSAACSNDSAEFNNSSSITNGSISGQIWNFGDGFSSTASDPKHKYAAHGSYNTSLIVESNNGCTDTATAQATVNPSPVANFTAPNVCFGSKLFLSNKSTVATGLLWKYNWDFGDGNTSTQLNPVHTYTTKDTFTIKLISESDKSCKDSIERDVIVDSKIIPDFSFDSLCFGDSTAFKNQTNTSCGSVTGFFWDFGDGDTSRGFSPTHKYASAGTYNVKLIVYQGIAKDSVNKQVTINSIPNAVFNANNACQNEDVSFSNNSNISTGSITNYSWNFGDGAKSTATAPKHAYSSNGTYQAYLVATGTGGCTDTATKSISVYELPSTNFSVSNACLGSSVNFSNSSSITSGTLSYSWQFGDGFSSTQKSPSYNYANSGNYTVKLSAESNNGCTTIDSQSVTIHPKPSANFSANNQCSNQSISFNNSSSISTGTISYLWKFGDNTTSTAINPKHQYASPGTYSVTLVVTSNNNCVDSVTKTVNALPTPIANFTVPSPCSGTKITFANASTVPSGTMSHVWNFGDGNSSSTTSPTHTYSSTGTYQVKLVSTSTSGCKDSITKTVNVYDIPTASFSVNGKCLSDSIAFGNTSTIGAGSMTYSWSLGDGTTSSKTSINHKYANSGTYQVKLVATSNGGCKDSSTQTINITPTPIAAFTANNVCLGESTSFSNSSSISSGTISYFWDFDNGLASTQENPSIKFTNSGSYNVELIATSNNGCSDTATNQVDVFVNPKASFSFANKCLDDTTIFTNNSTITTGTLNFAWDFDDGNNSLNRNPKHRFGATGSYLVELIAISNNACTDTIFKQININPKAIPAFATSNACFGETVDFKNNSSLSSGTYSNSWAFGDGNTSSAINAQNLYAQAGTYFTKLTLTTDSGCVSSQTKAVIINNKPTASFSTANVCQNKTALFTNASSINSGKISAYSWSFGDGFGSNSNAPNHQYTSSGSYNVELIASSDSGCTDTANQNISIYPTPTTAFTVTNICFGDTLYPSNNSTIKTGSISSYNWNFSDGNSATSTNPFNYYTSKGTYNVKLVTTSNNGCKDSLIKQTVVDNVIVPGFTFSNVCLGQKAAFTNTTNASCGNISSYQWAFGDGSISSQQNPDYTYKTAGTFNVRLIVTQKSGGRDTLIQQITVNPNPTVSISVNDTCAGISPTFINNSSISGGSISSYSWSFGDGTKSTNQVPNHIYTNQGVYSVKLTALSNNGCIDSADQSIEIFELPTVNFSASGACLYDSLTFNNISSISSGSLTFNWAFGDSKVSSLNNPKHLYQTAGKYNVSLSAKSQKGCSNMATKSVFVNHAPLASFTIDTVCIGTASSFINGSSISKGNIASYNWIFGDGFGSTSASPTHKYASFGSYTAQLIVLSDSGCTDTTTNVAVLNAIPNVSFSASNVCLGDDLSPKNNSTISSGTITNWSWDFDDTNTSNAKSPTNTYASKGTYNIKLVATSNNGCKDSTTNQVVVDNVIIAGFTTNDVCLGDTAFFTNTTNTSCGTITGYQWDFGDGAAATTANPFRVYTKAGTFDVRLIVVQQGGNRDTAIVKVTVSPKPKVNFFASNECANEQVQFQNLSTISLGSISSFEWNFKDGNKATAQNPKHNYNAHGQYDVSLIAISNKGCIDSSSKSIDIYEVPKVDFIANDVCFGASVDFKNGSSISTGSMNYTWTFGDGFSSTQSNPTYTYKKADNYTVKLTATSNNFCQESLSKALKVNEVPNIAYTVNDTCALDELNINNTTAIGSGTLSYIWTFDNSNSSVAKNPTYAIANSGTFDIKLKVLSNLGCSDSLTQQVEIFEKPNAQFTYSGSCPDKPVSFTNTSTPSSSITSQQWLFNGSNASTTPNPSYTFGTTGPHQVLLTVTNSNNCIDTSEQQIIFESVPVASFSFNNACERDTTYFTNNSEIKSGTATYQWSFGDGNESTINNGKNVYSTLGLYDVKLIATSDKGCKDSITQTVNPINKPEIDFNIQGACLGDSSIFMNLSTQNTGTYYLWNFGDNSAIDSAYNTSHLYANTGTYQVKVTGFASTGCSDTLSKKITVAEGPKNLDFTYNNACARSKVQFTNQTKNSNLTFRWAFFDGSFSTQRDPQKYYAKAGEYPIGFEAREGDCADSTYKLITIYPYADSSFTFIGLGNREISFEPIDSNINSFEWKFGDGNSSTDYNPSHTYSSDGTYKVVLEVTTPNGCKTVSEREVVIKGNSISWNSQNEIDFSVYPNPFKEHLIGEFEILNDGHVQIQIFNEVGQLVKTPVDENLLKGKYQYSLLETSSELKTGVYFVKMISNDSVAIKTVILQR